MTAPVGLDKMVWVQCGEFPLENTAGASLQKVGGGATNQRSVMELCNTR